MTKAKKPPTQVAGVEGIAPKPIELTPARPVEQDQQIDWARLCELPPFQMFAVEREPKLSRVLESRGASNHHPERFMDSEQVIAWMGEFEPDDLYQQYCDWHKAKGYWPNETPTGELKTFEA